MVTFGFDRGRSFRNGNFYGNGRFILKKHSVIPPRVELQPNNSPLQQKNIIRSREKSNELREEALGLAKSQNIR